MPFTTAYPFTYGATPETTRQYSPGNYLILLPGQGQEAQIVTYEQLQDEHTRKLAESITGINDGRPARTIVREYIREQLATTFRTALQVGDITLSHLMELTHTDTPEELEASIGQQARQIAQAREEWATAERELTTLYNAITEGIEPTKLDTGQPLPEQVIGNYEKGASLKGILETIPQEALRTALTPAIQEAWDSHSAESAGVRKPHLQAHLRQTIRRPPPL